MRGADQSESRQLADPVIERLDLTRHDPSDFNCGKVDLNSYIRHTVRDVERDRAAACFVLVDRTELALARRVFGYFTLSGFALAKRQARRRDRDRNLGRYDPVPAVLIGRLALDRSIQGRGLGSELLVGALGRVLDLSRSIGIAVVVVHAIDDDAAAFYERHGFTRFRDEPKHPYYSLATFVAGFSSE